MLLMTEGAIVLVREGKFEAWTGFVK